MKLKDKHEEELLLQPDELAVIMGSSIKRRSMLMLQTIYCGRKVFLNLMPHLFLLYLNGWKDIMELN